jgi:hypothetical protein
MGQAMKEKPIIFKPEMVRAIIEGRKTQTRRVIKPQPPDWINDFGYTCFTPEGHISGRGLYYQKEIAEKFFNLPYEAGMRLWVREAYFPDPPNNGEWEYYDFTDGVLINLKVIPDKYKNPENCIYRATWTGTDLKWKPSIHMPRWASRITLEVTGIRVERVQDISGKDSIAEGVTELGIIERKRSNGGVYYSGFSDLWDSINKEHSWDKNPWVWVVGFKDISHDKSDI